MSVHGYTIGATQVGCGVWRLLDDLRGIAGARLSRHAYEATWPIGRYGYDAAREAFGLVFGLGFGDADLRVIRSPDALPLQRAIAYLRAIAASEGDDERSGYDTPVGHVTYAAAREYVGIAMAELDRRTREAGCALISAQGSPESPEMRRRSETV